MWCAECWTDDWPGVFPCVFVLLCCAGNLCIEWPSENGLPLRSAGRFSVPETRDVTMGVTLWRALCVKQACCCMKDVGFFFSAPPLEVWTFSLCSIYYATVCHIQKHNLQRQHRVIIIIIITIIFVIKYPIFRSNLLM